MASYTGHLPDNPESGYSTTDRPSWHITNGWGARWDVNWGGNQDYFLRGWGLDWGNDWGGSTKTGWRSRVGTAYQGSGPEFGSYTNNRPIALRNSSWTGYLAPSYSDVFYNRILQEPSLLEFGSVVTEQNSDITVWNAFFVPKTLTNVIETSFDSGTTFSGQATPSIFGALEERTYQITVTPDGPPTIDAILTFDWQSPIASTSTDITGSRVLLLPIVFSSGIQETLEFRTDVLTSWDGTEQRVRQRLAPRQRLALSAYLPRSEMQIVDNLLYRSREQIWVMGLWPEATSADPITATDTVINNVETRYGDFRVDSLAIVWESSSKYDVFQIAAKTDSTLTATGGIANSYSSPIVMPVRSVRILGNPVRDVSGYDSRLTVNVEVTDNIALPTSPSSQQFNGEDTYFEEPLLPSSDGAPDSYQHRIEAVDYQTGAVQIFAPWENIKIGREFDFIFEGQQAIWEFREWVHRRAGRLTPFYMPTFENNFRLTSVGTIGASFTAVDEGYDFSLSNRGHLVFRLTDGTWEPRTITGSTVVGSEVVVTFTPALNELVTDIDDVGFFGLKRLGADAVQFTWLPNNVMSVTLNILEIEP